MVINDFISNTDCIVAITSEKYRLNIEQSHAWIRFPNLVYHNIKNIPQPKSISSQEELLMKNTS